MQANPLRRETSIDANIHGAQDAQGTMDCFFGLGMIKCIYHAYFPYLQGLCDGNDELWRDRGAQMNDTRKENLGSVRCRDSGRRPDFKNNAIMMTNPIFPGFHADPCVCRRGDDYYVAFSSFEWLPGLPVYHSRDLINWELYTHILTDDREPELRGLPSAKGIWAPCLTYCEAEDTFYCVYGVMNSMNGRFFDINNYLVTAKDIRGPWSEPVYLHSAGFDASLFHDEDGRKWLVSLEWETRSGYEHPGAICLCEYLPEEKRIDSVFHRIWRGGTDRGCLEAPHLTKRNGFYYLMCAEGGTGYGHCVSMARARSVFGPYEGDPENPILTSQPEKLKLRGEPDHLKPYLFNPASPLQKCGHGSYVDLPNGESYLFHLCARPMLPELRCVLGRETAIQKMEWTEDGWLRLACGGNLAKREVIEPTLPRWTPAPSADPALGWYAPRISPHRFAQIGDSVRLRGQESLCSTNEVSLLARKLTSVHAVVETSLEFAPTAFQHSAGLVLYYDNMNYLFLRKYWSDTLRAPALGILHLENGEKREYTEFRTPAPDGTIFMRLVIDGNRTHFEWSSDGESYTEIGGAFPTDHFSDEYSQYGEFTGSFVGLACVDSLTHSLCADFGFFDYRAEKEKDAQSS